MSTKRVGGFVARRFPREPVGYLTGTVKVAGTPDSPVARKIHLFRHETEQLFPGVQPAAWVWSGADGEYRFDGLTLGVRYGVVAYDHTGVFDPVIKLNLVPSELE